MKKLISRNPVLRFKEGKKIVKAQHGWGKYPGVPGLLSDYMYRMTYPSDIPLPGGMYLDNSTNTGNIYSTRINNDDEYFPISSPKVIQNGTYYETKDSSGKVIDRGRYFGEKKHSLPIGPSSSNKQSLEKVLTTEKKLPLNKSTNKKISFKQAFNTARNSGKQEFIWNGKRFNTKNKGEENYVFLNGKWIAPSVLLPNVNLSELKTPIVSSITPINNQEVANLNLNVPTYVTADRSQTRDWMRTNNINPYSVSGATRAAIRRIRAGQATDNDKLLVKGNEQLYNLLKGYYKKGGQLPSRNIVERFKQGKKIVKALQGETLPTAPKAEKRYRKSSYNTTKEGNRETTTITSQTFGYNRNWPYFRQPATILRIVEHGDTAFVETPEHHIFTKVLPRTALKSGNTYVEYNPKYDENYSLGGQANTLFNYSVTPLEYETLKRRFNIAWNLAK